MALAKLPTPAIVSPWTVPSQAHQTMIIKTTSIVMINAQCGTYCFLTKKILQPFRYLYLKRRTFILPQYIGRTVGISSIIRLGKTAGHRGLPARPSGDPHES